MINVDKGKADIRLPGKHLLFALLEFRFYQNSTDSK